MLYLVWPLAQSLSSMVVPTRSQNSSWHSLWDLRGTQAPQLRQSNNTLGGFTVEDVIRILDDSDISDLSDAEEQPFANDADGVSIESSSDDDRHGARGYSWWYSGRDGECHNETRSTPRAQISVTTYFENSWNPFNQIFWMLINNTIALPPPTKNRQKHCIKGVRRNNLNLVQIVPCAEYKWSWKFCENLFILFCLSLTGIVSICPPVCPSTPL